MLSRFMNVKRVALAIAFAGLLLTVERSTTGAEPDKKVRVLMLTESRGFTHGSVRRKDGELAPAEVAMTQLGQQTGLFTVDCTQNCEADFTKENLKNYDIVVFYTTGVLPISDETRDYFTKEWLREKGHGFIGFHSATDTFRTRDEAHRWYWDIAGGSFDGHPWGAGTTVTVRVHDSAHPSMAPFGSEFQFKDEIYKYYNWNPKNVRVLMSLAMEKNDIKVGHHVPVAWCRSYGDGKIFINNLGHNNQTWTDPKFLKSTENAVKWILNQADGQSTPNPEVSAAEDKIAQQAAGGKSGK